MRVLICGAGPTGLTLAVEMARRGIIADVVEARDAPSQFSRAVGILQNSMRLLEPSGVAATIAEEALAVGEAVFHHRDTPIARLDLSQDSEGRQIWALPQDRTELHLRSAFERLGGKVRYETPLKNIEQTKGLVRALYGRRWRTYDYVVGADGVRSTVRTELGIGYEGYDLPGQWSIADCDVADWPGQKRFSAYLLDEGNVVIVIPIGHDRVRVISSTPDALQVLPVPIRIRRIRRAGAFTISVRLADTYCKGNVFLAGDAAHCHSPVGGRGMNLGIADAADLAERLASANLDGYSAARRAAGEAIIQNTERARKALMSKSKLVRAVLMSLLWTASRIPPVSRALVRQMLNF